MGRNCDLWIESFNNLASPLVKLDTSDLILDEDRHHSFKEMVIWYMYGTFQCTNKKCAKKRPWNSTQCSTSMLYRYDPMMKQGIVFDFVNCALNSIDRSYGHDLHCYFYKFFSCSNFKQANSITEAQIDAIKHCKRGNQNRK